MPKIGAIEHDLQLATDDLSPAQIRKELAQFARESLADEIQSGNASERYSRYVNDRADVPEESVELPGPILYEFDYQNDIADFALQWARDNSPVDSGAYRDAWFVLADGAQVDPKEVPVGRDFYVTNDKPYHRKIQVGAQKVSVPPGIVERLRQQVLRLYGNFVSVELKFIPLSGGYILKGHAPRRAAAANNRSSVHRAGGTTRKSRKDTAAGQSMTYPSILVSVK